MTIQADAWGADLSGFAPKVMCLLNILIKPVIILVAI